MYDVMATTRAGRGRRERRRNPRQAEGEDSYWSPDRHRTIGHDEVLELVPALASRDPHDAYLFYDCQTDDVRLVLTVLGEAERYGAVALNGAEVVEVTGGRGRAAGVAFVEADSGERIEVAADHVVNATGVWADAIRPEVVEEEDVPRIAPSRGTHLVLDAARPADGQRRLHRPGGRRADDLRAALVRADADRHHRQRLRRRHPPPAARRGRSRVPARRGERLLRHRARRRRPGRRLRRGAAADLERRPAQVGRHLAQGGALRDLVGDADDHRRKAHDLPADGEADRRPAGRARRAGSALPDRRDPARDGGAPGRPRGARRGGGGGALPARLPLRPRGAAGPRPGPRAPRAGGADRPRPSRPARRGGAGGAPRAGALARRRAAAAHPAGDPRGAGTARPRGAAPDRGGDGGGVGLVGGAGGGRDRGLGGRRRDRRGRPGARDRRRGGGGRAGRAGLSAERVE